jgi:hypothetical protein
METFSATSLGPFYSISEVFAQQDQGHASTIDLHWMHSFSCLFGRGEHFKVSFLGLPFSSYIDRAFGTETVE